MLDCSQRCCNIKGVFKEMDLQNEKQNEDARHSLQQRTFEMMDSERDIPIFVELKTITFQAD